jgi:3-oxoacyl-[acyl-carrier protein] reductase
VIAFTRSLSREAAPYGVRVNAIAPGFIETDMLKGLKEEYRDKVIPTIPLGRFGNPDDVARVALFLATNDSGYITGQILRVDGGLAMQ